MIEAQKGQVWAESKGENHGSTFFIQLPLFNKK
jgi:signal transduction histidine kinase